MAYLGRKLPGMGLGRVFRLQLRARKGKAPVVSQAPIQSSGDRRSSGVPGLMGACSAPERFPFLGGGGSRAAGDTPGLAAASAKASSW